MAGKVPFVLVAAVVATATSTASAAVLAEYGFTSYSTNSGVGSSSAETVSIGVTASPFTFTINSNEADSGQTDTGFSTTTSNHAFLRSNATGQGEAAALADDDFFSFTVTADPGKELNLTSLAFDQGASNGTTAPAQQLDNVLYAIVNGSVIGSSEASFGANTGTAFKAQRSFSLTAPEFQGLSSITFRLAFSDNLNFSNVVNRLDDVVLNGVVVAVPEPAGLSLLAAGAAVLGRRRRV